jgi:hypothetical protein
MERRAAAATHFDKFDGSPRAGERRRVESTRTNGSVHGASVAAGAVTRLPDWRINVNGSP